MKFEGDVEPEVIPYIIATNKKTIKAFARPHQAGA